MRQRVFITGIGVVSAFGVGKDSFWDSISKGISASRRIKSFDASKMPTRFWAQALETDEQLTALLPNRRIAKMLPRAGIMSMLAAEEAWQQSGISDDQLPAHRLGISVGAGGTGLVDKDSAALSYNTSFWLKEHPPSRASEAEFWSVLLDNMHPLQPVRTIPNAICGHLAIQYGAMGHCLTYTTACTSSAQALGEAMLKIRYGIQDVMIAGGADSGTNPSSLLSFSLLGALSTNNNEYASASRPFDKTRDGFMLGEGAAFFILESESFCRERGGYPLAELRGYGTASDAYRITDEPEDGRGAKLAMSQALQDGGLTPEEIGYINAHGTSTRMNDPVETHAIRSIFDKNADTVPVSSTKSMIGHLVAGAGAIEGVACVLAIRNNLLPPTAHLQNPDPKCKLNHITGESRPLEINHVLSNSFGFGGQNACLIFSRIQT